MSQLRYFIFLFPEDQRLQELLDLAIYIINPSEKWPAHVTLAGPYSSKRNLPRNKNLKTRVSALGAGQFRSEKQNTVFLNVGANGIEDFWDKPDYSSSKITPHLTIYDGDNPILADMLFRSLEELRPFFFFFVNRVHVVSSTKGQLATHFLSGINLSATTETSKLKFEEIPHLSTLEKVHYAMTALKKAKYYLSLQ